jgi:hypothetical protein
MTFVTRRGKPPCRRHIFPAVPRDATTAEAEAQLSRKAEFERDMRKLERQRLTRMAVTGTSCRLGSAEARRPPRHGRSACFWWRWRGSIPK